MHTYILMHIHTYIHTYIFVTRTRQSQARFLSNQQHTSHLDAFIHTYIHTYMRKLIKEEINIHKFVHTHIYICIYTHTHTYLHTCSYIYIHIHPYIRISIHTSRHAGSLADPINLKRWLDMVAWPPVLRTCLCAMVM